MNQVVVQYTPEKHQLRQFHWLKHFVWLLLLLTVSFKGFSHDYSFKLTPSEKAYLDSLGPISLCVDPNWRPFEYIDSKGNYSGIVADLISIISKRTELEFEIIPTKNWSESLRKSKLGNKHVLPFLNETKERSKWLAFTDAYFRDDNVFITREEHPEISKDTDFSGSTIALPKGTSIEEQIREAYPSIRILIFKSEKEAFKAVNERKADMTLRSLTMAAYIIKAEGWFNLKIAGKLPDFVNEFRMGVHHSNPQLLNILNKAVNTLDEHDIQRAINNHVSIKVVGKFNYAPIIQLSIVFILLIAIGIVWNYQLRKFNQRLSRSQQELIKLSEQQENEIKQRKLVETELRHSEDMLRELNAQKDKFFSIIAHDLRSPFTAIVGFSELLAQRLKSGEYEGIEEYVEMIVKSSKKTLDLLMNLLEWARSQTGKISFNPEYFEIREVIEETIFILSNMASHKSINIVKELPANVIVYADRQMLSTIVRNLVSNAIKFTPSGGKVTIMATRSEHATQLMVTDTGIGISRKRIDRLFKIDTGESTPGTHQEEGTGLGLILCKEFTDKHGGTLEVESEQGKGSTFTLTLPLHL